MTNLLGHSLGRYHILEQLGQGGMATVYKAYDTRLERDVAVKVLRTDQFAPATLERILKRFEREAKALARLTHPNIVPVIDYGEHEGAPYLVMPYLPGGTLKQKLKDLGRPLPWQDALRLLLPVARALDYAHKHNILHRDVKPSNILLTEENEPLLTDFGIAKILDLEDGQTLTATGVGVGTPEYMSPEQGLGKPVDARTDVYSLGVVLYEMVTGRKPFQADTPMAVVLKQATEPLPRPSQFAPGLPEAVEKILLKALAKQPEDRYQSMAEFAAAMERALIESDRSLQTADSRPQTAVGRPPSALPSAFIIPPSDDAATVDQTATDEAATVDQGVTGETVLQEEERPQTAERRPQTADRPPSPVHRPQSRLWLPLGLLMLLVASIGLAGEFLSTRMGFKPEISSVQELSTLAPTTRLSSTPILPTSTPTRPSPTSTPTQIPIGGGSGYIYFWQDQNLYRIHFSGTGLEKVSEYRYAGKISWIDRNTLIFKTKLFNTERGMEISALPTNWSLTINEDDVSTGYADKTLIYAYRYWMEIYKIQDDLNTWTMMGERNHNFSTECADLSPDANKIALFATGEVGQDGVFQSYTSLRILNLKSNYVYTLLNGIGCGCVDWSPDGNWIAYAGENNLYDPMCYSTYFLTPPGIHLVSPVNSNQRVQLTATEGGDPAWSPDSQWLAFANPEGLYIIRADGSEERRILTMPNIRFPSWQP